MSVVLARHLTDLGCSPFEVGGRRHRHADRLFALDSAGRGFAVTSLLVLWLDLRFDLSPASTGGVFFAAGLLAGLSQLLCGPLADRIGLVAAAFAPTGGSAIALLVARASLSQMDVPARQAFVMSVVPPEPPP